ncbi:hypothetical protein [Streptomyces sp. WELS2]|uniref:hypothetical protein n=1 Tax=Streptomyces sp. WELS2 TaxID=2749435 RepID=UPI0015F0A0FE|nr:hypothetical protein [Streptomyces sp. WELS2]
MSASTPEESRASDDVCTPDALLHSAPAGNISPEDLVMAAGRDVTPKTLEPARRRRLGDQGRTHALPVLHGAHCASI